MERIARIASGLVMVGTAACGSVTFGFINQGDRPPGADIGLPPPPAEAFESCRHVGHRLERLDTNGDGKVDVLRISTSSGVEVCRGVDTNLDGKLDTWDLVKDGRVVARAHDSDSDGKVDQHWTWPSTHRPSCAILHADRDGDGKPDPEPPKLDPCGLLGSLQPAVVLPPVLPPPLPGPRRDP